MPLAPSGTGAIPTNTQVTEAIRRGGLFSFPEFGRLVRAFRSPRNSERRTCAELGKPKVA